VKPVEILIANIILYAGYDKSDDDFITIKEIGISPEAHGCSGL